MEEKKTYLVTITKSTTMEFELTKEDASNIDEYIESSMEIKQEVEIAVCDWCIQNNYTIEER